MEFVVRVRRSAWACVLADEAAAVEGGLERERQSGWSPHSPTGPGQSSCHSSPRDGWRVGHTRRGGRYPVRSAVLTSQQVERGFTAWKWTSMGNQVQRRIWLRRWRYVMQRECRRVIVFEVV